MQQRTAEADLPADRIQTKDQRPRPLRILKHGHVRLSSGIQHRREPWTSAAKFSALFAHDIEYNVQPYLVN